MSTTHPASTTNPEPGETKPDKTKWLYLAVIAAVVLGAIVGLVAPGVGKSLAPLGTGFVNLIKMMISPIIFCTIVLGIGSVRSAASVGRTGTLALVYFLVMSTFALAIGLVVGNFLQPGSGLEITPSSATAVAKLAEAEPTGTVAFLLGIIPTSLLSSLTTSSVLQTLLVALLVGFALQSLGKAGQPVMRGIGHVQKLVFKILTMILWLSPLGAFGAIANVVGQTGVDALVQLGILMFGFYLTCIIFVFGVLGALLRAVTGFSVFKLARYLGREYLLIVATSSSESALPRLIAKMEHVGVERTTVGIVVPTGYSFNLDGTAIYLTMASIFIADALGKPLAIGEQVGLLLFMIVASKGAAGVSGAGLATLAGGLQAHRPELLDGVGFILGIDKFMSEARALTNFSGNAIATLLVGTWTKTIDADRVHRVLDGEIPFDEALLGNDPHGLDDEPEASFTTGGPASAPSLVK